VVGHKFNVALLNCYLDGKQYVNWHADSEDDLIPGAAIVSLTLGCPRELQFRHRSEGETLNRQHEVFRKRKEGGVLSEEEQELCNFVFGTNPETNVSFNLGDGDLLIMKGTTQQHWKHRILKDEKCTQTRISITFRYVREDALQ